MRPSTRPFRFDGQVLLGEDGRLCARLPIRTRSELNTSEHWQARRTRHKRQKATLLNALHGYRPAMSLPCLVRLIRIAPRALDADDNLPSAFKHIKDCIADWLIPGLRPGRADGDPRIKWEFGQQRGRPKCYEIIIEIIPHQNQPG